MTKLPPSKVPGKKAGPNGSFPIGDKKHARLAIGGATRSYNAGNISASTEAGIKAKARAVLKGKNPHAKQTSAAPAKDVPFSHPPRAFPMDADHSGNAEKK